jgi:hypothetical protein
MQVTTMNNTNFVPQIAVDAFLHGHIGIVIMTSKQLYGGKEWVLLLILNKYVQNNQLTVFSFYKTNNIIYNNGINFSFRLDVID